MSARQLPAPNSRGVLTGVKAKPFGCPPATEYHPFTVQTADRLMTVEDLCAYLGVSKDFIYDQVRDGRLLAIRIARQLHFRPPDVDAFVEANAVAGCDM
ncbi:MAG: helix-turn-helix domain-containing protein [Actinomycetota bacterium]|nr:helix-turn-helix domain-containing protein [Actinomycetota bacterium]